MNRWYACPSDPHHCTLGPWLWSRPNAASRIHPRYGQHFPCCQDLICAARSGSHGTSLRPHTTNTLHPSADRSAEFLGVCPVAGEEGRRPVCSVIISVSDHGSCTDWHTTIPDPYFHRWHVLSRSECLQVVAPAFTVLHPS